MVKKCSLLTALIVILVGCVGTGEKVIYSKGRNTLSGSLCKPQGTGPFPVVVYNHGGTGPIIGGAPEETCTALAEAGFLVTVTYSALAYAEGKEAILVAGVNLEQQESAN